MQLDTPRKKTALHMLANFIFTITLIVVAIGVLIGFLRILSEKYFSFYGGIGGTIMAYVINAFEACFLAWLLGMILLKLHLNFLFIFGGIDWKLGLYIGPFYTTYCWITGEENKGLKILRNDWPR